MSFFSLANTSLLRGDRGADSGLWSVGLHSLVRVFFYIKRNMACRRILIIYNLGDGDFLARLPLSSSRRLSSVSFFTLYMSARRSEPPSRSYENIWWSRPICRYHKGRG